MVIKAALTHCVFIRSLVDRSVGSIYLTDSHWKLDIDVIYGICTLMISRRVAQPPPFLLHTSFLIWGRDSEQNPMVRPVLWGHSISSWALAIMSHAFPWVCPSAYTGVRGHLSVTIVSWCGQHQSCRTGLNTFKAWLCRAPDMVFGCSSHHSMCSWKQVRSPFTGAPWIF